MTAGKLCLNMIVKNEEENILDCLRNVAHLVDAIAIVDTGSTDRTVKIINKFMKVNKIPGEVICRPWYGFNVSRTEALRFGEDVVFRTEMGLLGPAGQVLKGEKPKPPKQWKGKFITNLLTEVQFNSCCNPSTSRTRDKTVYNGDAFLEERLINYKNEDLNGVNWHLLFMDADNRLKVNGWKEGCKEVYQIDKTKLDDDQYGVDMRQGSICYRYSWSVKVDVNKRWIWNKEIHEHVVPFNWDNAKRGKFLGSYILSGRTGSRSKDPCKYLNDAVICERHMLEDPNDDHYVFYGAQSYRDAGKPEESLKLYIKRAQMKGWMEQVYISWLEAGKLQQKITPDEPMKALEYFMRAFEVNNSRLEAPFYIIEIYRSLDMFKAAFSFAKPLMDVPKPIDLLFVDEQIHGWMFYDSASISAYYSNNFKESMLLAEKALNCELLPLSQKERIKNAYNLAKQNVKA